jgi:hypothetical protein
MPSLFVRRSGFEEQPGSRSCSGPQGQPQQEKTLDRDRAGGGREYCGRGCGEGERNDNGGSSGRIDCTDHWNSNDHDHTAMKYQLRKKILLSLFVAVSALAQLEPPSIGTMRDAAGAWHAVYGVAGNFMLGPETTEPEAIDLDATLARLGVGLSSNADELVLRRADGNEVRFALAGIESMRAMSAEYVQVSAGERQYVLRLKADKETLYLLPAAKAEVAQ